MDIQPTQTMFLAASIYVWAKARQFIDWERVSMMMLQNMLLSYKEQEASRTSL